MSASEDQDKVIQFPTAKRDEAGAGGSGEFFSVDRRTFAEAAKLSLNAAVAYLTIARGAGSRSKSAWSVDSIERYTGISRPKAKLAIKTLVEKGLLTIERPGTRPLYGLTPAHALPKLTLSDVQVAVFEKTDGRTAVSAKNWPIANDLAKRGLLKQSNSPFGGARIFSKAVSDDYFSPDPQLIWLPNAIVEGAADERPPLALLRQMQDIRRLQLFVALYDNNDLPNDGGVSRAILHQSHILTKVSQRGASTIWGFATAHNTVSGGPLPDPFRTGQRNEHGKDPGLVDFWSALEELEACGLLTFIPHIFESDTPEAEMLHAYPIKDRGCEPWERSVAIAAHNAGIVCIPQGQQDWAIEQARHLLPVPSHITNLAVIGIARLRYRPRTKMTAAWFAKSKERAEEWLPIYESILQKNEAAPQKPANTNRPDRSF
jgi:hypothetical protein